MIAGTMEQHRLAIAKFENAHCFEGLPKLSSSIQRLRIWQYPSFEPISSWSVFGHGDILDLRRLQWDRRKEFPSNNSITQIFGAQAKISQEAFAPLVNELAQITFNPLIEDKSIHLDGTEYGIELGADASRRIITWRDNPPDDWRSLMDWHQRAILFLEQFLPESSCR